MLPPLLAVAACGGPDPVAREANTADVPLTVNATAPGPPPATPDGSPPPAKAKPAGGNETEATAVTTIPAFLHGRWGMTPQDCTSTRGDAKGLLVITAGELRFYESRAVPVGNLNGSDNSFSADYRFNGEGQTWTSFETLQLQRTRLVRTTSSPMASYTYAKCS
ncbi:hypothetical protein G7077_04170 [Sphingomonas piscis]|uniref:Uncharacterized protein n=1 Tax=Sphingomonas piscis TaxID=2714943 RepID=A0A6G7YNB0_9SPHN|nr:hypothetical protein [Sphingomonas piscis]QIK78217.1 hypothetical protein G7077_04170 [Sphingomonas piscis]